jgi:hypothetical protein
LREWNWGVIAFKAVLLIAVAGALGIASFVIFGPLKPDEAAAGGLVALAGVGLAVLASIPSRHLISLSERISTVTVGKYVSIKLNPLFESLAAEKGTSSQDPEDPADTSSLVELKRSFDMKLAYLAKHVLAPVPGPGTANRPTFVNIGSLAHDKYLTADEAEMAYEIVGMRPAEFTTLPSEKQRQFLIGAGRFVDTIRITVFAEQVSNQLRRLGWSVRPVNGHGSRQRDVNVWREANAADIHHVIPVFTERKDSRLFAGPRKRLRVAPRASGTGRRFIVVPPLSKAATDKELLIDTSESAQQRVWTVTLTGLTTWLQHQPIPPNPLPTGHSPDITTDSVRHQQAVDRAGGASVPGRQPVVCGRRQGRR